MDVHQTGSAELIQETFNVASLKTNVNKYNNSYIYKTQTEAVTVKRLAFLRIIQKVKKWHGAY